MKKVSSQESPVDRCSASSISDANEVGQDPAHRQKILIGGVYFPSRAAHVAKAAQFKPAGSVARPRESAGDIDDEMDTSEVSRHGNDAPSLSVPLPRMDQLASAIAAMCLPERCSIDDDRWELQAQAATNARIDKRLSQLKPEEAFWVRKLINAELVKLWDDDQDSGAKESSKFKIGIPDVVEQKLALRIGPYAGISLDKLLAERNYSKLQPLLSALVDPAISSKASVQLLTAKTANEPLITQLCTLDRDRSRDGPSQPLLLDTLRGGDFSRDDIAAILSARDSSDARYNIAKVYRYVTDSAHKGPVPEGLKNADLSAWLSFLDQLEWGPRSALPAVRSDGNGQSIRKALMPADAGKAAVAVEFALAWGFIPREIVQNWICDPDPRDENTISERNHIEDALSDGKPDRIATWDSVLEALRPHAADLPDKKRIDFSGVLMLKKFRLPQLRGETTETIHRHADALNQYLRLVAKYAHELQPYEKKKLARAIKSLTHTRPSLGRFGLDPNYVVLSKAMPQLQKQLDSTLGALQGEKA